MPVNIYFDQSFHSERLAQVANPFGGYGDTWTDSVTFKGCLRPLTGDKQLSADRQTIVATHRLYCPIIDLAVNDRVVDSAGRVYRIVGVIDSMSAGGYLTADLLFSEHDQDAEPEPEEEAGEESGGI